ncbi:MAG: IS200/IS605 family transposase, partial [Paludibacter sp.]
MSNTYHKMYIQCVFAVKYRNAVINKSWRSELMAVMGNLVNETGCHNLIVNGVEDHVHCFFGLIPNIEVSEVMQRVKAKSSKWVNESGILQERFEWQRGFGAFSYSPWDKDMIFNYVKNQEIHHTTDNFRKEYTDLLKKHEVEFDEAYIFDDLI